MKTIRLLFVHCDASLLNKAKQLIQKDKKLQLLSVGEKEDGLVQIWKIKPDAVFCEYKNTFLDFFNMVDVSFSEKIIKKKNFFTFVDKNNISDLFRLEQKQIPHIYAKSKFEQVFFNYITKLRRHVHE